MTPKTHSQDLITVCNIDEGCDHVDYEVIQRDEKVQIENGQIINRTVREQVSFDHSVGFTVMWDNVKFIVRPGETKIFPRYLAEHFAQKLASHLTDKVEEGLIKRTGKKNVKGFDRKLEINKFKEKIIVDVHDYYFQDEKTQGEKAYEEVEKVNKVPNQNSEAVTDRLSELEKDLKIEDKKAPEEPETVDDIIDKHTKKELQKECDDLGIEYEERENKQDLADKIKAFC